MADLSSSFNAAMAERIAQLEASIPPLEAARDQLPPEDPAREGFNIRIRSTLDLIVTLHGMPRLDVQVPAISPPGLTPPGAAVMTPGRKITIAEFVQVAAELATADTPAKRNAWAERWAAPLLLTMAGMQLGMSQSEMCVKYLGNACAAGAQLIVGLKTLTREATLRAKSFVNRPKLDKLIDGIGPTLVAQWVMSEAVLVHSSPADQLAYARKRVVDTFGGDPADLPEAMFTPAATVPAPGDLIN